MYCVIVFSAKEWIFGMTVIPDKNEIYYTDYDDKSINVLSLKTRNITILINKLKDPRGFALDRNVG